MLSRLFWSEPCFLWGGRRLERKPLQVVGISILSIFAEMAKSDIIKKILRFPSDALGYVLGTGSENKGCRLFHLKVQNYSSGVYL